MVTIVYSSPICFIYSIGRPQTTPHNVGNYDFVTIRWTIQWDHSIYDFPNNKRCIWSYLHGIDIFLNPVHNQRNAVNLSYVMEFSIFTTFAPNFG